MNKKNLKKLFLWNVKNQKQNFNMKKLLLSVICVLFLSLSVSAYEVDDNVY